MSGVYRREQGYLDHSEEIAGADISREELKAEYLDLASKFKLLLRKTEKLTRISDSLQKTLREEQERSEKLLLNTLPEKVVEDLKKHGSTQPKVFKDVSVFFSDIVNFTNLCTLFEPAILIDELNSLFTGFDDIMVQNKCERIKTIGDAYLAVCGMPQSCPDHAVNMVTAANEILEFLEKRNATSKFKWEIRIGIHTGDVVGGIVGVRKYIYDVFGDTINTTSRMESNSEPMKINVSESTYQLAKSKFSFVQREETEVKGKGAMKMFFLDRNQNG